MLLRDARSNKLVRHSALIEYMINNFGGCIKYSIYVCVGICLCLLDQIIGSATGSIQYGVKHYTGVLIAVMILTAYNPKDFLRIPYFIWTVCFFVVRYFLLRHVSVEIGNYTEFNTFLWNVGVYGIVVIRLIYCWFIEKNHPHIRWFLFAFWLFTIAGMAIIRNDFSWIVPMLLTYICFYLTKYKERDLNNLYSGLMNGIILGFFVIQMQAWMYRPYDRVRYHGMYSHANMNALLYICAYFSVLAKWYLLKLKGRSVLSRAFCVLLIGLIGGTCIFTGSRTALITLITVSFIFLVAQFLSRTKKKLFEVIVNAIIITLSIGVLFFPSYALIRYIPAYVDEPLYFEGDVVEKRIQKGDSIDSEKYIELEEAVESLYGRYLWFQDDETVTEMIKWWKKVLEQFSFRLSVQAADLPVDKINEDTEEYVEPGTDRKHPLEREVYEDAGWYDVRLDIYRFFINKLQLVGERGNEQGVWLTKSFKATHCHNIYLQFAYDFGIIIGIMFLVVTAFPFWRVVVGLFQKKTGSWYYRLFVTLGFSTILVVFGMLEINWIYGQLPFTMFWIVQYSVYHKQAFEVLRN